MNALYYHSNNYSVAPATRSFCLTDKISQPASHILQSRKYFAPMRVALDWMSMLSKNASYQSNLKDSTKMIRDISSPFCVPSLVVSVCKFSQKTNTLITSPNHKTTNKQPSKLSLGKEVALGGVRVFKQGCTTLTWLDKIKVFHFLDLGKYAHTLIGRVGAIASLILSTASLVTVGKRLIEVSRKHPSSELGKQRLSREKKELMIKVALTVIFLAQAILAIIGLIFGWWIPVAVMLPITTILMVAKLVDVFVKKHKSEFFKLKYKN